MSGLPIGGPHPSQPRAAQRPTGEDLLAELRQAANARGVPLRQLVAPLVTSSHENFIAQLGRARRPLQQTIDRVRACAAGQPIPPTRPSPFSGHCGGSKVHRADGETRVSTDEVIRRRALAERAHAQRLPGETLQHAVARLTGGASEGGADGA